MNELTFDDTINPFDNNLVIIDEVHNFISRVINGSKIGEKIYELIYYARDLSNGNAYRWSGESNEIFLRKGQGKLQFLIEFNN